MFTKEEVKVLIEETCEALTVGKIDPDSMVEHLVEVHGLNQDQALYLVTKVAMAILETINNQDKTASQVDTVFVSPKIAHC